ncbi:hypothetical protein QQP08_009310 [Theobroma cacao]|nr:hypothetical protein QQP08_009310 [Theobroma cacao]
MFQAIYASFYAARVFQIPICRSCSVFPDKSDAFRNQAAPMMKTCLEIEQALALTRCWVLEILAIGLAVDPMSSCLENERVSLMGCLVGSLMKVLATGLAAAQERLEGQGFGQLGWMVADLLGAHWLKDWPYLSIYIRKGLKTSSFGCCWVGFIKRNKPMGKGVGNSRNFLQSQTFSHDSITLVM